MNPMDLSGKSILVTGASSGIGQATAFTLSQLGARTIMVARNEEKLQQMTDQLAGKVHNWYSFDLRDIAGIEALLSNIVAEHGPIDGLVHCAGVQRMMPLKMLRYELLHEMMLTNFYSFVELVRGISKRGNYRKPMSIVGISSVASVKGEKTQTAYSASKAAMDGAIRVMAQELSAKGIRINSIVAGFVKTEMFQKYIEKAGITETDKRFDRYFLGIGEPVDIARAVAFLLSDSARMITGTGLVVDSGATT